MGGVEEKNKNHPEPKFSYTLNATPFGLEGVPILHRQQQLIKMQKNNALIKDWKRKKKGKTNKTTTNKNNNNKTKPTLNLNLAAH